MGQFHLNLQYALENFYGEVGEIRERKTHKITIRLSEPAERPLYEALYKKDNVDKIAMLSWIVHSYWKSGEDPLWVAFSAEQVMRGLVTAYQRADNKDEFLYKVYLTATTPITNGYLQDAERELIPSYLHFLGYKSFLW